MYRMQIILAQAQASQGNGMVANLILFGAIALIFYFFMIRPQQRKQKEHKKFREEIKKGDDVVTIGGLHGKIFSIEDEKIVLEVDNGVRLTFDKSAISMESSRKMAQPKK